MLDIAQIIQDYLQHSSPQQIIVNPNFGTGDFTGWNYGGVAVVQSAYTHDGDSYAAELSNAMDNNGSIGQNISTIPLSSISSFTVWVMSAQSLANDYMFDIWTDTGGYQAIDLHSYFAQDGNWHQIDLLAVIRAVVPSATSISDFIGFAIAQYAYTAHWYIDDVDLAVQVPNWIETNPSYSSLHFQQDEFNINSPDLQILLENMPDRKVFIREDLQRVEHRCRITIFVKPPHYDAAKLDAEKVTFTNMKTQIDKIIAHNLFTLGEIEDTPIQWAVLQGWDDTWTLQRGFGSKNIKMKGNSEMGGWKNDSMEPIVFQSMQLITCFYYVFTGSGSDLSNVPLRIDHINIGYSGTDYEWIGITNAKWKDLNPWELLEIAGGTTMVEQSIHPVHIEGSIIVRDFASLKKAIYTTAIDGSGDFAVNADGTKWNIGDFTIVIVGHNGNVTATFTNAKIKTVEIVDSMLGKDNTWRIDFMADLVQYS